MTTVPIALLVGPGCVSSCDSFARVFKENDFGVLIGEPTAAGHTTARLMLPIALGKRRLGKLSIAVSYEVSGKTDQRIEAVPVKLDHRILRRYDNRDTYDRLLVNQALESLRQRKTRPNTRR